MRICESTPTLTIFGNVIKKIKKIRLRAHLFNTTVFDVLTCGSEPWVFHKQEENPNGIIERSTEKVLLGIYCFTQRKEGIRSSHLRHRSKIRDAVKERNTPNMSCTRDSLQQLPLDQNCERLDIT
ncbi:hypothetical protein RB195_004391 [Necator americanus]|uniref:Uncharacterized protein n=1 Tax=Necator americanus TaxID=51031 RepID=A0ABR1BLG6_NECAM